MNLFKMFPTHNEVRFSTLKLTFVDAGQFNILVDQIELPEGKM